MFLTHTFGKGQVGVGDFTLATVLLKAASGLSIRQVTQDGLLKPVRPEIVSDWNTRYPKKGLDGLLARAGCGRKSALSLALLSNAPLDVWPFCMGLSTPSGHLHPQMGHTYQHKGAREPQTSDWLKVFSTFM